MSCDSQSKRSSGERSSVVVDAHTHIFPPEFARNREAMSRRDAWFAELYQSPKALLANEEDLLMSMEVAGVDCSIVCGFPWLDPGICREHNDYLLDVAARNPRAVAVAAIVSPLHKDAAQEAQRCLEAGAVAIGELNADAQGFELSDPEPLAPLVEVCQAYNRPMLFHVSEPVGHLYPGKGTSTPDRLLRFLARYPDVKVIAAHWGGGLPFYELMPEVAELTRNLVYDTAASTYLYSARVFHTVVDLAGPERILMGSDYALLRQDRFIRRLMRQELDEDALDLILGKNAERAYRLSLGGVEA